MTFIPKSRGLPGVCLLAVSLTWGMSSQATIIFQTDFEAPGYSTGALAGQDGWSVFGSAGAVSVDNAAPIGGAQSARIDGALVAAQTGPYHSDPSAISMITLSADIMLTSSNADRAWQFAAIGSGLVGFAGGIDIDANGDIRAITSGFANIGNFTRDIVHRVDLLFDYSAQLFSVVLDGSLLADNLAFCGDNGPCAGASVGSYNNLIFDTFGSTGSDVGYIDNILVQSTPGAVPEPATSALLGIALAGLAGVRRRLRTR